MPVPLRPVLVVLLGLVSPAALAAQTKTLVLRGATLIDGADRPPTPIASIVIVNGWITAVGPSDQVATPRGARIVDLTGRFVVPGFVEAHGHLAIGAWEVDTSGGKPKLRYAYDDVASKELTRSQLAFGITSVRNPAGPTPESVLLRNRVRWGEWIGPRIVTSGAPLDPPGPNTAVEPVATEDDARAAVARQAAAGVDFIKVYSGLQAGLIKAAVDEAHRRGLTVVGHLWQTSWTDAARAGIDGITHIIVNNETLLPEAARAEYRRGIRGGQFMFDWFKWADFDGPEIREMLAALVARRLTIDPTLVAFETTAWWDQPDFYPAESGRYTPPTYAAKEKAINALRGWSAADYQAARAQFPRMQELARRLHQAGVPLTVGTDGANPWLYHRELELLSKAGIANADVLRMATRNGAQAMGRVGELGTVEVGKRADLVVLDADPIADITNTRRIAWVLVDGKLSRPTEYLPARLRPSITHPR